MSFVRTLAALAAGFVAARGVDKYRQMGGMDGIKDALKKAGDPGGPVDQLAQQAEKLGLTGGAKAVRDLYEKLGGAGEAAEVGLGNLISSMTSATTAGSRMMGELVESMTGASPGSPLAEENARLMIRAMIQAAKADGEIDAEERKKILDHLGDASDEEIAFVEAELNRPLDPVGLARDVGESMREQIYATSLMAIRLDSAAESLYLDQLANALGLSAETRARLHAAMGRKPPAT